MPQLPEHLRREMEAKGAIPKGSGKRNGRGNKYRVSPPEERTHNGVVYASKAEMQAFRMFADDPDVQWVARQAQFLLTGGITLRVDFLVKYKDIGVPYKLLAVDVKGFSTQDWRIKKQLWQNTPGLPPLRVIKNGKTLETITPPARR